MKSPSDLAFSTSQRALLYTASLLVPSTAREEWRREWLAELWHVRRSCISVDDRFSLEAQREITSFCLGAFPDALCLRSQPMPPGAAEAHVHGSVGQTLVRLVAAGVICCVIASLLPGVQAEKEAARYQVGANVILIGEATSSGSRPSISTGMFRQWKTTRQRFFDDLAFYRVSRERAGAGPASIGWKVAHSTWNVFSVLGLPIDLADLGNADSSDPALILSRKAWIRDFGGDPRAVGHAISVGNVKARIAGVAPAGLWQLPGAPDAWLLDADREITSEAMTDQQGFLLAKLSKRGSTEWEGPAAAIAARDRLDNAIDLYGVPMSMPVEGPWNICAFALFLALLALPAVTSVSLGESQLSSHRPTAKQRLWRTLFLIAKFVLIGIVGFYASLDIAYCTTMEYSPVAECLQLMTCFAICLIGFRWAVADQRQRCPMCLRRVTNPASVGLASRTFLGWNGTELICMGGHALLHVPSLPTSWFGTQRWLYLDSSWEFLFSEPSVPSTY
jgi:hypothetical protein